MQRCGRPFGAPIAGILRRVIFNTAVLDVILLISAAVLPHFGEPTLKRLFRVCCGTAVMETPVAPPIFVVLSSICVNAFDRSSALLGHA